MKSIVEKITRGFKNPGPFLSELGVKITSIEKGRARISMKVKKNHMNPNGVLHGGIPFILGDTVMGISLWKMLKEDELPTAVSVSIDFLRPVKGKKVLVAEGRVVEKGDRIVFSTAQVFEKDNGETIARVSGVFYLIKLKGEE